ncbi:MAG TPA: GTPase Era [Burkholderiales bacterium]|nr:GTPase Era [Burkholderiales bacterium]
MSEAAHRAGYIAIVGRPNVGKSTLLNRLIGQKISITSRKPQTTRQRITGILTRKDAQLVFVDTPGFQTQHRSALTRIMNRSVTQSLQEVDVVLWVIEALKFGKLDAELQKLLPKNVPLVLAINKVDRLDDKNLLLPFVKEISERRELSAIVPLSAQKGERLDELLKAVVPLLPEGPPLFGEDEITTSNERFLATELIREKLFRLLGEELPYATAVEIERFETQGELRRIYASIIVDKANQKAIVIGKGGEKLKLVATQARKDMERLFGGKVFLEVWVKVKSGWADSEATLRRMGYE